MRKSIRWAFAGSLAVNLILVGFILGRWISPPNFHHMRGNPLTTEELDSLSPEKRKMFDAMLETQRDRMEENASKIEETRHAIVTIMEAPQFDEEQFIAKSKEIDSFFSSDRQQMITDMATLAKQCTQEERKSLTGFLRRPPRPPIAGGGRE